jgi:hypothetical protein
MDIGKIVDFSAPLLLENGPVPFRVRLKNQSNHFTTPQGSIAIKNIFGKTIGQIKLSPVNILANTTRLHNSLWKEDFLFGHYTATLTIKLSDKEQSLIKKTSFFFFPFRILFILITIFFVILLIKNRLFSLINQSIPKR